MFVGLDYASLEDRINTLLTKDPNKTKVYTDGFDGHSYRAYAYWGNQMPLVQAALQKCKGARQLYKVTLEDGSVEYLPESDPLVMEYLREIRGETN